MWRLGLEARARKVFGSLLEEPAAHQVVGRVMAYQANDG